MSLRLWLSIISLTCLVGSSAHAQIGDPIDNYLSSAEQKANNVVYNAGAQGRGVAMEAGQAVLNAIASFRAAYADSLKKTESTLTREQEEFFRKIKSSVDMLDETLNTSTGNLQTVTDTMAGAITNLPFSSDVPRVTKVYPLYAVDSAGPSQELIVRGIGLSNGSPVLEINGKPISPNTKTDAEIRFPLPSHGVITDKPLLFPVTLRLFERERKMLGLWNDYIPRTYSVRLAIYPRAIGKFTVTPRRQVANHESNPKKTPQYRCVSPHGDGSSTVPVSVAPTPGWTIDVSSIVYNREYENHGVFTMNSSSAAGFTATLSCSGWGRQTVLGQVVDQGQQGVEQGTFSFLETREGTTLENGNPETKDLQWGDSLTVSNLPADTETILFELKPFTGETLALEGVGTNRFAKVDFNASSKVATVTALSVEQALRQ